ncbi:hypothetical protein ABZ942_19465 [Nocardia sp. NPDC046473]|uniref:hypothetical protein n=1 Tax=Nocardia sp. NPDC046473 TaxID=3155733 RepID=UPI0033EF1011
MRLCHHTIDVFRHASGDLGSQPFEFRGVGGIEVGLLRADLCAKPGERFGLDDRATGPGLLNYGRSPLFTVAPQFIGLVVALATNPFDLGMDLIEQSEQWRELGGDIGDPIRGNAPRHRRARRTRRPKTFEEIPPLRHPDSPGLDELCCQFSSSPLPGR